jgi:prepilin-type N-terminal cleavage/methylation domain-containing protein
MYRPEKIKCLLHRGFTLLEVLVSVAIVGGAIVTLIYTLNYHLGLLERQRTVTEGVQIAKTLLESIEVETLEIPKKIKKGELKGFQYILSLEESPLQGVYIVEVEVRKAEERIVMKRLLRR